MLASALELLVSVGQKIMNKHRVKGGYDVLTSALELLVSVGEKIMNKHKIKGGKMCLLPPRDCSFL